MAELEVVYVSVPSDGFTPMTLFVFLFSCLFPIISPVFSVFSLFLLPLVFPVILNIFPRPLTPALCFQLAQCLHSSSAPVLMVCWSSPQLQSGIVYMFHICLVPLNFVDFCNTWAPLFSMDLGPNYYKLWYFQQQNLWLVEYNHHVLLSWSYEYYHF